MCCTRRRTFSPHLGALAPFWCGRPSCAGLPFGGTIYSILFYSTLFYSILFYSILFYSILFYSILFYSILFYSILFYSRRRMSHKVKRGVRSGGLYFGCVLEAARVLRAGGRCVLLTPSDAALRSCMQHEVPSRIEQLLPPKDSPAQLGHPHQQGASGLT